VGTSVASFPNGDRHHSKPSNVEDMEPPQDSLGIAPERPLTIYDRLLRALQRLAEETGRTGDDTLLREWSALALLDAIDLGDVLGWLAGDDAERRREAVRATIEDLD
jgi:hypothetical protein